MNAGRQVRAGIPESSPVQQLVRVISKGETADILKFARENLDSISLQTDSGQSPLMAAAYSAKSEVVQFLLESRADPNTANKDGWAALHFACTGAQQEPPTKVLNGMVRCVQLLLEYGANPQQKDDKGVQPF